MCLWVRTRVVLVYLFLSLKMFFQQSGKLVGMFRVWHLQGLSMQNKKLEHIQSDSDLLEDCEDILRYSALLKHGKYQYDSCEVLENCKHSLYFSEMNLFHPGKFFFLRFRDSLLSCSILKHCQKCFLLQPSGMLYLEINSYSFVMKFVKYLV